MGVPDDVLKTHCLIQKMMVAAMQLAGMKMCAKAALTGVANAERI
jgi:hypothetical protein